MEKKAKDLGIGYDKLEALALEAPNAFLTLIGEPQVQPKPLVNGSVNPQALSASNPQSRDWDYYSNLRKTNRSLYFSPSVQQQMLKDKIALGDKFGN